MRDIWDAKAAFWDERMGEGNQFQLELIGPAVERLLAVRPGEHILDVGCGNGVHPAAWRTSALASWRLITAPGFWSWRGRARKILSDRIDYRLVDATDEEQLLALGKVSSTRWCATWC